ncbi:MAG: hypothetical protein GAK41_01320 [Burkholderia gladioli]|nr:MAG: hypothetical protein GAK41_01320 [Burkholderia gladioli]
MALRIEGRLGVEHGDRADLWLAEPLAYDLAQARARGVPKVECAPRPRAIVESGVRRSRREFEKAVAV